MQIFLNRRKWVSSLNPNFSFVIFNLRFDPICQIHQHFRLYITSRHKGVSNNHWPCAMNEWYGEKCRENAEVKWFVSKFRSIQDRMAECLEFPITWTTELWKDEKIVFHFQNKYFIVKNSNSLSPREHLVIFFQSSDTLMHNIPILSLIIQDF